MSIDAAQIEQAWRDALVLWDAEVTLTPPEPLTKQSPSDWGGNEPLAYIDLVRRQVVVNYEQLEHIGAAASLTGVLAHELGHHLRFPHTLGLSATLELLQRKLIPDWGPSLTNLFFDLQVNEVVGRTRHEELCAVYRGFTRQEPSTSPLFAYYLAIYEELWGTPPGDLLPRDSPSEMEANFPGWRADARMFAQTFYALTDTYLQFVYFCSRFVRYLPESMGKGMKMPLAGDLPVPGLDDYAGALEGNSAVDRALDEAVERSWIDAKQAADSADPLEALNRITAPGSAAIPFRDALVARIYSRLVERNLIKLPATAIAAPDPYLPTTLVDWEPGDSLGSVDWIQSVLSRGPLAALAPLRRELEIEPPSSDDLKGISVEIYLDTSGSMPAPDRQVNAMTLAAQILSASAIRSGGRVRAVIYSSNFEASDWMLSEELARTYLLRYSGGGTDFPFAALLESANERRDVLRVVISDSDFLYNVSDGNHASMLVEAISRTKLFVALLALPTQSTEAQKILASALALPSFRLARVSNPAQLPQAAAQLAQAFWGK